MSSLTNALALLSSFHQSTPELGVSELAAKLGLPKSSVSRLMSEMERLDYLERTPDRRYRPGHELLRIGSLYKFGVLPVDRIDTEIKRLVARFPASGYVAVNKGINTLILRMREGTSPVRFIVPEGSVVPAFTVAIGKAVMARMTDQELEALLPERATCETPFYDLSKERLMEELQEIRRRRWADLRDMAQRGVDAVGIAIKPDGGEVIGMALSFMATMPMTTRHDVVDAMLEVGTTLGTALGDPFWRLENR